MKLSTLQTMILAIIVVYAMTLVATALVPDSKDAIEKIASLILGGFLGYLAPHQQVKE